MCHNCNFVCTYVKRKKSDSRNLHINIKIYNNYFTYYQNISMVFYFDVEIFIYNII